MDSNFSRFKKSIQSPLRFPLFMFFKLPAAFFAGLRIASLDASSATISVKEKWFNMNPFKSIYFGILTIAAEVSTGILCMGHIYNADPPISMLVVQSKGSFLKKAKGKILFTCDNGADIQRVLQEAKTTGEGRTVDCVATGRDETGDTVANFVFTWSFKARIKK